MTLHLDRHPSFAGRPGPVLLMIADGVGVAPDGPSNAVTEADTNTLALADGAVHRIGIGEVVIERDFVVAVPGPGQRPALVAQPLHKFAGAFAIHAFVIVARVVVPPEARPMLRHDLGHRGAALGCGQCRHQNGLPEHELSSQYRTGSGPVRPPGTVDPVPKIVLFDVPHYSINPHQIRIN